MSRISSFSAGNAGASQFIALNGPQGGGDKKQGLHSRVGRVSGIGYHGSHGNNRDKVFNVNQLGGVGKGRSMFSTSADGVKTRNGIISVSPILTLFYQIYIGTGPSSGNIGSTVSFIPYTEGDTAYSGISTRLMSNSTFTDFTDDLINYVGYRVPSKVNIIDSKENVIDAIYKETFDILSADDSFISATSVYVDSGTTSATEIPTARFEVTCARGKFKDVKYAIITYDNNNYTRSVEFYI